LGRPASAPNSPIRPRKKPDVPTDLIVSPEPDIKVFSIDPKLDAYVIIASDGLWDFVSSKRAITLMNQYLKKYDTLEGAASALEREARQKGSQDDITIVIVMLKDLKQFL